MCDNSSLVDCRSEFFFPHPQSLHPHSLFLVFSFPHDLDLTNSPDSLDSTNPSPCQTVLGQSLVPLNICSPNKRSEDPIVLPSSFSEKIFLHRNT